MSVFQWPLSVAGSLASSAFPLRGSDGTNSAPTYSFSGATGTGMYNISGDLAFTTNSTAAIRIDSAANYFYRTSTFLGDGTSARAAILGNLINDGSVTLTGSSATTNGGMAVLYGNTHATKANVIELKTNNTIGLSMSSAQLVNVPVQLTVGSTTLSTSTFPNQVVANDVTKVAFTAHQRDTGAGSSCLVAVAAATSGTGDLIAAYNSGGSTRLFQVSNAGNVTVGPSGGTGLLTVNAQILMAPYSGTISGIFNSNTTGRMVLSSQTNASAGGVIDLYGSTHATRANVVDISTNGSVGLSVGATQVVTIGTGTSTTHVLNTATQSTVGAAGGASALPATPTGYIVININGTDRVIPYYAKT